MKHDQSSYFCRGPDNFCWGPAPVGLTLVTGLHRVTMTSQNLWSRYDRHFVGITWHNVWSYWMKIYHVIQTKFNQLVEENDDHQPADKAY